MPEHVSTDGRVIGGSVSPGGTFRWTEEGRIRDFERDEGCRAPVMSRDGLRFCERNAWDQTERGSRVCFSYSAASWQQLPLPVAEAPAVIMPTGCVHQSVLSRYCRRWKYRRGTWLCRYERKLARPDMSRPGRSSGRADGGSMFLAVPDGQNSPG